MCPAPLDLTLAAKVLGLWTMQGRKLWKTVYKGSQGSFRLDHVGDQAAK